MLFLIAVAAGGVGLIQGFCCHCWVEPCIAEDIAEIISIHLIFPFSTNSDILADVEGSEACAASSERWVEYPRAGPWDGFRSVVCSWWNPGETNASVKSDSWRIPTVLGSTVWSVSVDPWKWYLGPPRIQCPIEYLYSNRYISIYFNFKKPKLLFNGKLNLVFYYIWEFHHWQRCRWGWQVEHAGIERQFWFTSIWN